MFGISDSYNGVDFFYQLLFLVVFKVHVPLGQPSLARTILDQYEPQLQENENVDIAYAASEQLTITSMHVARVHAHASGNTCTCGGQCTCIW